MKITKLNVVFFLTIIFILGLVSFTTGTASSQKKENENEKLVSLKYDFGSKSSPVADGFTKVSNKMIYSEEKGYGLSSEVGYKDREEEERLQLRDFVISNEDYSFQTDLPNGTYKVKVSSGDKTDSNETEIEVDGEEMESTGEGQYDDLLSTVKVTDGKMTFSISGVDKRLNTIEITEEDTDSEPVEGVELTDNGSSVTMKNSKISMNVNKSTAEISSLYAIDSDKPDFNLVGGDMGRGYYLANYSIGDEDYEEGISDAEFDIVSESDERVEIVMTADDPNKLPFYVEVHMALEKDSPGLYYYTVYKYTDDMPDDLDIGQLRYAIALEDSSFEYFVVDDDRGVQKRPTQDEMDNAEQLQDTTFLLPGPDLPEGNVYSKYQNISNTEGDNHVFMASNGDFGVSLIQASKEYFDGGPTKQELTVHDYYDGEILLWHEHTGHYGTPSIQPEKGWEKMYGPFYLYIDESDGSDPVENVEEMWEDSKQASNKEQDKWPYKWIKNSIYEADNRTNVSGNLEITDHSSPENAWVILSPPGVDWQEDTEGYVYSERADENGDFNIDGVRPGKYTLTAFADGVMGEFKKNEITIDSGDSQDIGTLEWTPEKYGEQLWQIGTPNRSSEEFYVYGGENGFRNHLTWLEYPYDFPDDVDFEIGKSVTNQDWNYFQPMYKTPGTDEQLDLRGTDKDQSLTEWNIRFDSEGYEKGEGTLSIDLASSVFASLDVKLNGETISTFDEMPGPPGDNASYRQGVRGIYSSLDPIQFDANLIEKGENTITLVPHDNPKAPTSDDWMEPMAGIMYDVIRLEVDDEAGEGQVGLEGMENSINQFATDKEISDEATEHLLKRQLSAISHYSNTDKNDKAVKHMKNFKKLINEQVDRDIISEEAAATLQEYADNLITKWQNKD